MTTKVIKYLFVFILLLGASTAIAQSDKPGKCVIRPNQQAKAESLGTGVVTNARSVCDASIEGCGACVELCRLFTRTDDRFGCPLNGADGFCNPDFLATDPDCDFDGDGFSVGQGDCNDNDIAVFPGASEVCFDVKDNNCDGAVDAADPQCAPDGFCDPRIDALDSADCIGNNPDCPCYDERVIRDIETVVGTGIYIEYGSASHVCEFPSTIAFQFASASITGWAYDTSYCIKSLPEIQPGSQQSTSVDGGFMHDACNAVLLNACGF
jgi:hypothetical protein